MIVLDASVLIAHLDEGDAQHEEAREILLDAAEERFGAGPVTLAEVLVGPTRKGKIDEARSALRELGVGEIAFGPDAPVRLAALRAETGLKLPDCCVIVAAQDAPAQEIATLDHRLATAAAGMGLSVRSSAEN